jgi:hypothetical protein
VASAVILIAVVREEELLVRLVNCLDDDPAYEQYGELETSPWGSGQWVKYTDPAGHAHYLRVVVEPFRLG